MRLEVSVESSKRQPLIAGTTFQFSVDQKTAQATLRWYSTDPTEFSIHDAIEVVDPYDADGPKTYFSGYIVSLKASRDSRMAEGDYVIEARCVSKAWLLSYPPALITAVYQSTDDQDIILDALTASGLSGDFAATTSTIATIATSLDAAYSQRTMAEVLDDMAQASGGVWYEDSGTLYYNSQGASLGSQWEIHQDAPNGLTAFKVNKVSVERHWERPVTDITVLGLYDGSSQISATDSVGGSPPLTFSRVFESDSIVSDATAQAVAAAIIATQGEPSVSCSFEFLNIYDDNHLTSWNAFGDAAWNASNLSVTSNAATGPDGQLTAELLTEDGSNSTHNIQQSVLGIEDNKNVKLLVYAKTNGRDLLVQLVNKAGFAGIFLGVNLSTGAVVVSNNILNSFVAPVGGGWYQIGLEANVSAGLGVPIAVFGLLNGTSTTYTGDTSSGAYIWRAYCGEEWPRPPLFLSPNRLVDVTASAHGLSAETMLVRSVRMRQLSGGKTEFACSVGGIKPGQEALLRKIEAGGRRQQNLPKLIRGLTFTAASSEHVSSSTSIANIDDLTDFTVFATIRPDSFGTQTIAAKDDGSNQGWRIEVTSLVITVTRTKTSTNYSYTFGHGMVASGVYRLVVRSSSATGVRVWLNGSEIAASGSNLGSGTFDSEASAPFRIARSNAGNYFNGFIGSFALFNIALPETTAAALHNALFTSLPFSSNAQLIWACDEFEVGGAASGADSIRDRSDNGYHGTPANTPQGDSVVFLSI